MTGTAFLFPGQGSQAVGMGKALAERFATAREIFARIDAALGQNLSRLMFEGPEAELTLTANAQPALMAVSLAVARVLTEEAGLDFGAGGGRGPEPRRRRAALAHPRRGHAERGSRRRGRDGRAARPRLCAKRRNRRRGAER